MDWMQFVSALVSALAWPLSMVVVICLLKGPILGLIPKIRSFRYGDLHVDLTEALQSLKEDLPPSPDEPEAQPPRPTVEISVPLQIAAVSPRAGMIAAWLEVESALNEVLAREGIADLASLPSRKKMAHAFKLGYIGMQQYDAFSRTFRLRNEAVHMLDRDITYDDAVAMVDVCKRLADSLSAPPPQAQELRS